MKVLAKGDRHFKSMSKIIFKQSKPQAEHNKDKLLEFSKHSGPSNITVQRGPFVFITNVSSRLFYSFVTKNQSLVIGKAGVE